MTEKGHLTLGRGLNESVLIGDDIEVQVTEINRGYVRLTVEASRDVQVRRGPSVIPPGGPAARRSNERRPEPE
jgi:Global regulator protein family